MTPGRRRQRDEQMQILPASPEAMNDIATKLTNDVITSRPRAKKAAVLLAVSAAAVIVVIMTSKPGERITRDPIEPDED